MNPKLTLLFHGFLQLPNLEKLEMVNRINEYFDTTEREPIRKAADDEFDKLKESSDLSCPCCGR
jgi:hypothetical protein